MNTFVAQLTYKRALALMVLLALAFVCRAVHAEILTLAVSAPQPEAHLHVSKPATTPLNWIWLGPVPNAQTAANNGLLGPIFEYIDDPVQHPSITAEDIELAKN